MGGLHPCGLFLISDKHLGAGDARESGVGCLIQTAIARPVLSPEGRTLSSVGSSGYESPLLSQEGQEKLVLEKTPNRVRPLTRIPGPHVSKPRTNETNYVKQKPSGKKRLIRGKYHCFLYFHTSRFLSLPLSYLGLALWLVLCPCKALLHLLTSSPLHYPLKNISERTLKT